jgi:peptidyl-tRNA hydrolase
VGRPDDRGDIVDYVLTPFPEADTQLLNEVIEKAVIKVEETLIEMNKRNNKTGDRGEC